MMDINTSIFIKSSVREKECPKPHQPEFAFIGRSNVGKSSLINMLCGRKDLAKISSTPGKTQTINHFLINDQWYIVDLPGYGYARVSKSEREKFEGFITEYLLERAPLQCVMVLIDSRLEPQKIDLEFMDWLGENKVPFVIVFTKSDKNKKEGVLQGKIDHYKSVLSVQWETLPPIFISSAEKKTGREEILAFIGGVITKK
jgi:GTP-binding protein